MGREGSSASRNFPVSLPLWVPGSAGFAEGPAQDERLSRRQEYSTSVLSIGKIAR